MIKNAISFWISLTIFLAFPRAALSGGSIQNEDVKSFEDLQTAVLTTTGNTAMSNNQLTGMGSTAGLASGQFVYDLTTPSNIPSGTTITGVSGSTVTMSGNAAGNATGDILSFGGQMSQLINDTKIFVTAAGLNKQLSTAIADGSIVAATITQYAAIVANPAIPRFSTHTTIGAALAAAPAGSEVLVMAGTYTESVDLTKKVLLRGQGESTVINGNLTFDTASDFSMVKNLKIAGAVNCNSGVNGVILNDSWLASGQSVTDNCTGDFIQLIQE